MAGEAMDGLEETRVENVVFSDLKAREWFDI
jgi:hypothetical protein